MPAVLVVGEGGGSAAGPLSRVTGGGRGHKVRAISVTGTCLCLLLSCYQFLVHFFHCCSQSQDFLFILIQSFHLGHSVAGTRGSDPSLWGLLLITGRVAVKLVALPPAAVDVCGLATSRFCSSALRAPQEVRG